MIFTDNDLMELVFDTIRTYKDGSIGNFYFYKMVNKLSEVIKERNIQTDTDEVFDTFIKSIEFYNLFIETKGIDVPLIPKEWCDLIHSCISDVIENL